MELVFSNFRSVQSRLWPWDWTPEAMVKLMEDYDFCSKANYRGLALRIRIIEMWFNEVTRLNATMPQKRPLVYEEMKAKLVKVLQNNSK